MSFKLTKRLSSKKKRPLKDNAQAEILHKLGLEAYSTRQLDSASVLNINTWTLEDKQPLELKDLPNTFLRRLWLLSEDARSTCCQAQLDPFNEDGKLPEEKLSSLEENAINPLDLVTSVFISADTFLQQEITVRMMQCKFAVPLVLPNADPEKPSQFLLWPLRGVLGQWRSHSLVTNGRVQNGNLASTPLPIISCIKLGRCSVSKSQVLNYVLTGPKSSKNIFIHKGMDGGQVPRRLSNGLVEIGWYLPTEDVDRDIYQAPFVISNLRGDASHHERCLKLLCQASSAVIIFCGDFKEKEKQLLESCKAMASKLILIDVYGTEGEENTTMGYDGQSLQECLWLPKESVLPGSTLSVEKVANNLCEILKSWVPDNLKPVTLEAAAKLALDIGLIVDESPVCKKAMATVEEILKGLDEGSVEFQQKPLPLQGHLWHKLAELDKEESKHRKSEKETEPQLQEEKKDILAELKRYKMTPAMKIFIDALFTKDKIQRTYFLTWLKLRLQLQQTEKLNSFPESQTEKTEQLENLKHEADNSVDSDSFCTDSEEETEEQPVNNEGSDVQCSKTSQEEEQHLHNAENTTQHLESTPELSRSNEEQLYLEDSCEDAKALYSQSLESKTYNLGIEHFFREMGLIFELTHTSGSQNVLRLPKLAADLLLHGVPLELMDGDASNVPICWLSSIFAELNHSLHQEKLRTRVLTILGNHHARNAVVLSGLFGVELQEGWKRTNRGVYMAVLSLPDDCRKDLDYDLLLLIDVEGLGLASGGIETDMLIHDNMMATFAIGLSDVLLQNISPHAGKEIETTFKVMVSSLLRSKECGVFPICNLLVQDEGLDAVLQASQLRHVCKMLQTEDKGNVNNHYALNTSSTTFVKGPWPNMSLSETVDKQYTNDVLKLKEALFGALKRCSTKSEESDFIGRLSKVWDAVKSDSFSISLQNINMALGFSLLCTEFSQWEDGLLESMESWLMGATTKIIATKALDGTAQDALLSELKKEAQEEVKSEVHKLKSKAESYLMSEENLKMNSETFMPMLLSNMSKLQERASEEVMQKLETINESHCSLTQIEKFETSLEREQEFKLVALVETSKSTNILLQDHELEEEFESVWKKMCSSFDFRPSESDDISSSVADVLRKNLISRGLQKHMEKLDVVGQKQTSNFQVCDEHFGYRSRLKHMLEDNNKQQKLDAQKTANKIIEEYNKFSANKCSLAADFSESYITELLEMIENGLREKSLEIRSAFEVDLKIHLCNAACQDFQKLHDRFGKDKELLTYISETKNKYTAEFIYQFRKRDQCQRVAQAFISMVIKPLVLAYINQPLGIQIAKEIENKAKQFQSPHAFHQSILEDLINEDCFESFEQYLLFYEDYRRTKINDTVVAHLADTTSLRKLKQQRLGEVVGQIAAAVSQTTEGASGVLSDTKPLLERVCLILEKDANINVEKESLNGPLFSITTDWDCFVKCLLELLATMHLGLSQDFNQNVDVLEVLNDLSILPQDHLLQIVRGCDKRCPLCKAPCDKVELDHEIHSSLLHRPKGILPRDICSPFHLSSSETSKDSHAEFMICKNLPLQDTNWSDVSDDLNSQKANNYWRYVLVRFNEKFAAEYKQELAKFPEDWTKITKEEALDGLKEVFGRKECN
ncbi:interferon-induced very large GTPase 1 [Xiphophorus hellerii]|uniref:interferon-induced very large GTPase 1 n=1 Tax=Xiphophorus hellerii TaxID=8084 RepID=UPI0013B3E5D8|nr:interferon-induced very large GTPase 1-like [Xiphophorus hellerii]XP_032446569.1 interferon-induced very large GTPase 1-like [Xiphophorus hellerii]